MPITRARWKALRGSSAAPDQIMLSIKGDPARSMTVRWRTDPAIGTGFVLYREAETEGPWLRRRRTSYLKPISTAAGFSSQIWTA